jgi:FkbM family methyltransferase
MEGTNLSPAMTRFVVAGGLLDDDFTLIDVGCSGGIHEHWRAFGGRLRAFGFDPQRQECARLNASEANPRVRYFPSLVGLEPDHWFHRTRPAQRSPEDRYFQTDVYEVCLHESSAGLAFECAPGLRKLSDPRGDDLTTDRTSVSRFVREQAVGDVDFVKIDTDGADLEVLLSCEEVVRTGAVLGFQIETPFIGSARETDNSFHNIDRTMRQHGYCLFSLSVNRYSRRALPAPFRYNFAAQTETGQPVWGDSLYFRNAGSPHAEAVLGQVPFGKLLKLACLFEIFALNDCAAELIQRHRAAFGARTDPDRLLDLLTPPLHGTAYSYADYIDLFRGDVNRFFPSWKPPAPAEPAPARRRRRTVASVLRGIRRRVKAALTA